MKRPWKIQDNAWCSTCGSEYDLFIDELKDDRRRFRKCVRNGHSISREIGLVQHYNK